MAAFGTDTIRVLDEEPERLLKIKGVGKKSFEKIKESWAEHRGIRDLLLFLQPHGITPAYAVRIYRAYGGEALNVVRENPYRLAMDIRGIGLRDGRRRGPQAGLCRGSSPAHPGPGCSMCCRRPRMTATSSFPKRNCWIRPASSWP